VVNLLWRAMLIKVGADVHASGDCALRAAIEQSKVEFEQRLLYHGASLQAVMTDPHGAIAAIAAVAARGDVRMIEVLLDAGIPLDSVGSSQVIAEAAEGNRIAVIELFARRGASSVLTDSARLIAAARKIDRFVAGTSTTAATA